MTYSIGDKVCIIKDLWGDCGEGEEYVERIYATKNSICVITKEIIPGDHFEGRIEVLGEYSDEKAKDIYTHVGSRIGISVTEMVKIS
jgi:hypothetical protein